MRGKLLNLRGTCVGNGKRNLNKLHSTIRFDTKVK